MNGFFSRLEHRIYITFKRLRLKNRDFSILSDNCNGGIILHDLGLRFNSPTVNLFMLPGDYLKFLENPKAYLGVTPVEIHEAGIDYPVGAIKDIKLYFMHYLSFEEAKKKWVERSARVRFDNLYVLMTDKNGCTDAQARAFDRLPYAHKCFFTSRPRPDVSCAVFMKEFENQPEVGILSDWKPGYWKRRYIDQFDYVSFLNNGTIKK